MFSRIYNGGLISGQTPDEQKKIILLNKMALVLILGVAIKFFNELYVNDWVGISISLTFICLFMLVIVLNHIGQIKLATSLVLIILTTFLFIINILYGRQIGSEFIIFPLIMFVILYLDKTVSKLLWLLAFAVVYISSLYFLKINQPLMIENLEPHTFYLILVISTMFVFIISNVFIEENKKFSQKTSQLLEEVSNKNKKLKDANTELERFAFIASHDLKTPLRNINSFLKLIERKIQKGNTEDINEYLNYASLNAQRMHNLIEDILTFSRLNTEELPFQLLDLNLIVKEATSNLEELIKQKGAEIKSEHLPHVYGNRSQLSILFQNLIENGIKYNASDSPMIQIKAEKTNLAHRLIITDNGIGIPADYYEKVFDMFFRLHSQADYSGTGIGLATCHKIAIYHGGNISIVRSDKSGTTFLLELAKLNEDILTENKIRAHQEAMQTILA